MTARGPRRVRPRDWVVVAVVAAIALALGGYLLLRPSGDQHADASAGHARGSAAGTTPGTTSGGSGPAGSSVTTDREPGTSGAIGSGDAGSSPMGSDGLGPAPTGEAPTGQAPSGPMAATSTASGGSAAPTGDPGDGVVDSMIQPPVVTETGVTDPSKAPRIGPLGDLARRVDSDPLALGRVDAPVVMVSFEDYRCPFCAQFARTTEPALIEKYVKTGVLRIEWRDLPIFGAESTQAAIAGRAAAQQGRFWQFVHAIYADAPQKGHPDLPRSALIDYARKAGVRDIAAFTKALDDPALAEDVDKDLEQGSFLGVPSTPAFVINGYPIVGAQPLTEFTTLIDTVRKLQ